MRVYLRLTGITNRSEVCVSEKLTTLLSTSPAAFAAAITSTSLIFAALPFNDTTQIAPLEMRCFFKLASCCKSARLSAA